MTSKDYDVVFTASASHALHLLASSYSPVEGEPNDLSRVHFSFCNHSHTSVVGMRAELRARGATVQSFDRSQVQPAASAAVAEHGTCTAAQHHLVAYPAMCNFSGERYPLDWCGRLKAGELRASRCYEESVRDMWPLAFMNTSGSATAACPLVGPWPLGCATRR